MSDHTYFPRAERRHWSASGLSPRQERRFHWIAVSLILLMMVGWTISVADLRHQRKASPPLPVTAAASPPEVSRIVTSALLDPRSKSTAFLDDAALTFLTPLRGESGKLRAAFRVPGEDLSPEKPASKIAARYKGGKRGEIVSPELDAPTQPGIYEIAMELDRVSRPIDDLKLITLVPFAEKKQGRIGLYYLGRWPFESGAKPRSPSYANPDGFVEVTRENQDTNVSEHFRLRDFLTKDQGGVWPKYLLLQPKLLDKLELVIAELKEQGYRVEYVHVMSGFRTPRYNHGGGNTGGRANLSRHMYGDAADIFVDNDRNGRTDDLNRDGRVDLRDTEIISRAAEAVEREYPALVGGIGTYVACCGHGPFTHLDVRGYRARWRGTGNG